MTKKVVPTYTDDDFDMRFQVADPGFTKEQDAIYEDAMAELSRGLEQGLPWKKVTESLSVADPGFKAVILDDFLKIAIAQRHFQDGEGLKIIARSLKVPMDLLVALKAAMIEEVSQASVKVYNMNTGKKSQINS